MNTALKISLGVTAFLLSAILVVTLLAKAGLIFQGSFSDGTENLHADVYPVPQEILWTVVLPEQKDTPLGSMVGTMLVSEEVEDMDTELADFIEYYTTRMEELGWEAHEMLAADGPTGSFHGYEKDGEFIIFEHRTIFRGESEEGPLECPCDTIFSIFSGTLEGVDSDEEFLEEEEEFSEE